jgi:NADH-quinone oxidoreductase subunit A
MDRIQISWICTGKSGTNWGVSKKFYFCANVAKSLINQKACERLYTQFFDMNSSAYFPVILQSLVAIAFVAFVLVVTHMLGPARRSKRKDDNFECGIESEGNARIPVSIKYFMTAILFVLFDVEVIFFYPYAVNFRALQWEGFAALLMFVAVFLVGFTYVWKKGALEWDR